MNYTPTTSQPRPARQPDLRRMDDPYTAHELTRLRARLLRLCLEDGAQPTADLLRLPDLRPYNRRWLQKLIHSLAWAGLLDRFGTTSGTYYLTSRLGYVVLASLDEDIACNARHPLPPAVE